MENLIVKSLKTEKTKTIEVQKGKILRNAVKFTPEELQNPLVKPKTVKR